jgi:hypothetical protein
MKFILYLIQIGITREHINGFFGPQNGEGCFLKAFRCSGRFTMTLATFPSFCNKKFSPAILLKTPYFYFSP